MEAFILAAGLGTRLRPLTNSRPKALIEIEGKTLLEINLEKLIQNGASRIVINVHHFASMIEDYIQSRRWGTEILISRESDVLLDTGGGLKHAESLFTGTSPIIIHNVDILSDINIKQLIATHCQSSSIATLCVSRRDTSRKLLFDKNQQLIGWHNQASGEFKWSNGPAAYTSLAFSGVACISPQLLPLLPKATEPYPIIPEYLSIAQSHEVKAFEHSPETWLDVGKPDSLSLARQLFPLQ